MSNEQMMERIALLEKQVATLSIERDDARASVVISRMVQLEKREGMRKHKGKMILPDHYVAVRLGRMSLEAAVAARDEKFPIFSKGLGLAESYEAAL